MSELTPLMRQYWDIKSLHQDKILLFRMGDFFEMFFDDAIKAAPILGITLTSRNKKSAEETPMCGMPHHAIAGPINKLLKAGLKIAICDQVEDPKLAKGIVKRAVTRVLSPGMVYDTDTLESSLPNYLASISEGHLACLDTSTGEAFIISPVSQNEVLRLLAILPVAEIVANELDPEFEFLKGLKIPLSFITSEHFGSPERLLIQYVSASMGPESLKNLKPFEMRPLSGRMDLNSTVIRHLEIFANSRGELAGSLFSQINRTQTSAGARLLRQRLSFPMTSKTEIEARWQEVLQWSSDLSITKRIREVLGRMGDIERRLSKLGQPQCNGRDLRTLAESVLAGCEALVLSGSSSKSHQELFRLAEKILMILVDEPPLSTKQGHLIKAGVNSQLDELVLLSTDSHSLLAAMEARERETSGISSLKIRYNNVFGYYIEITHTHKDKVPKHYLRKQTLANAERYCTDELVELEKKVLSAQTRRFELESEIFEQIKKEVLGSASELLRLSQLTSELDVATANAWLAAERKYCLPKFTDGALKLVNSRHPVVEQTVNTAFVPNTIQIEKSGCLLLTGPNMAGKSTLMRQVALIAIMAQAGLFVPAESAQLPVFEHIFTRIGASDQLSEGLSTFMVEMTETATMLKRAGPKSLLILDEIGRGTSTFDGMSLAQSILEFVIQQIQATTLFATHYQELTNLDEKFAKLKNVHMKVTEKNGQIEFLHTLAAGPAQKSYGIQVARLAGVPAEVTRRAATILLEHEKKSKAPAIDQLSFDDRVSGTGPAHPVLDEIKELQVPNLTPLQALQKLADWQGRI